MNARDRENEWDHAQDLEEILDERLAGNRSRFGVGAVDAFEKFRGRDGGYHERLVHHRSNFLDVSSWFM
jgi:hypothetical protein